MPETLPTIDDMVFENRNKEYGSYQLRKRFNARLGIGFLVSLALVALSALGYFWYLTEAGDENIYQYSQLPSLKSVQGSLLSKEELDAYTGSQAKPEKEPADPLEKKTSGSSLEFIVTENANPDTFKPEPEISASENISSDMGLLVNDSTVFGGFLSGDGMGAGSIFDRRPEFPGGDATKYVEQNLRYPAIAIKQKIHGTVIITFVISKTGHVTDVKVERGVDPIIDNEAIKTIKNMPPWKPGMIHGKPINVQFRMPINFIPVS